LILVIAVLIFLSSISLLLILLPRLQEWVSAWRLAGPDKSGMRVAGRTTVRPFATFNVSPGDCIIGQPVDAWWNDGWWEGIIVNKEPSGDIQVYFPGMYLINPSGKVHLIYCCLLWFF